MRLVLLKEKFYLRQTYVLSFDNFVYFYQFFECKFSTINQVKIF